MRCRFLSRIKIRIGVANLLPGFTTIGVRYLFSLAEVLGEPFSATMRRLLERAGVPDSMVWTEDRSRSTHENAAYGAQILRERGIGQIILVAEAQDMLRAERCFRKEGLIVAPAPFAFRRFGSASEELIPSWKAVDRNERTLHETLGLGWYWLRGWI